MTALGWSSKRTYVLLESGAWVCAQDVSAVYPSDTDGEATVVLASGTRVLAGTRDLRAVMQQLCETGGGQ